MELSPFAHPLSHIRTIEERARHEHPAMSDYIENWIDQNHSVIRQLRERPELSEDTDGVLLNRARKSMDRLWLTKVGKFTGCWIERDVTIGAMLLDWRVKRIKQRLKQRGSWEENWASGENLHILEGSGEDPGVDKAQRKAAVAACVFAVEWQDYLLRLLVRPPRDPDVEVPDPVDAAFATFNDYNFPCPEERAGRFLAELAHCRPGGAFFESAGQDIWTRENAELVAEFPNMGWHGQKDDWLRLGGRRECRRPTVCPHCFGRMVRRLVERINRGPWKPGRRRGSHLVLLRVSLSTSSLGLRESQLAEERRALGFDKWLRLSDPGRDYTAATREEAMIRYIDMEQHLTDTLTPTEISVARQAGQELLKWSKNLGMTGGIRTHTIGPRGRQFRHEICVVGEIRLDNLAHQRRFEEATGLPNGHAEKSILGQPIECLLMPKGMASAARFLVAGTGWGTNLDVVGAKINVEARRHTHIFGREGEPAGLRGALAWQPLFLLSGAAFWSRAALLTAPGKFQHYAAFGSWIDTLPADEHFEPRSKKIDRNRRVSKNSVRAGGRQQNPALYVRRRYEKLNGSVSVAALAELAGCHRSTMDKLLREGKGSPALIRKALEAIAEIEARQNQVVPGPDDFQGPGDVEQWLRQIGKSQVWLAEQIRWTPTRVSRQLRGCTAWSQNFKERVCGLVRQLTLNPGTNIETADDHRNVLSAQVNCI